MILLLRCMFYAINIWSDFHFYSNLDLNEEDERIATMVHIILPLACSSFVFITLLFSNIFKWDSFLIYRFPFYPFTTIGHTILECKSFINKKKEEADYDKTDKELTKKMEDQKNIIHISRIIEASIGSSFQFLFQGLFSLPTLFLCLLDIQNGALKDWVNWKYFSIVFSFISFASISFNIRSA